MQLSTYADSAPLPGMTAPGACPTSPPPLRDALLALAVRPAYGVTLALAGVVSHSHAVFGPHFLPLFGLDASTTQTVLEEHFPGAYQLLGRAWTCDENPPAFAHALELEDLVAMLLEHRTIEDDDSRWLAHAIATACLGDDHLWQDMGLPSRQVLGELFHGFFTSLAVRNLHDMKWKKFLYKQLCERAEIRICKAPSCGVCADYTLCFGSEV